MPALPTPELLDGDTLDLDATARALDDLRRANRILLGYRPLLRTLLPRLEATARLESKLEAPIRVLDVGTGSGDVAHVLRQTAQRRGLDLQLYGVDLKLRHLTLQPLHVRTTLHNIAAPADRLPFVDDAFDWSFSTLFFHHFDATTNRRIVEEMLRVSRHGVVVVDLVQSPWLRLLIRPGLRLLGTGSVAYHDGIVSAGQAWSLEQVRSLCAGLPIVELRRRFPFRFSLVLGSDNGATAGR